MYNKLYKVLLCIYEHERAYLRQIARKTDLPHSTVQHILSKAKDKLLTEKEGRNKYYMFKNTIENDLLKTRLEIYKTQQFLKRNQNFKAFFEKARQNKSPSIIFGSYIQKKSEASDIDILYVSEEDQEFPTFIAPKNVHLTRIHPENLPKFKAKTLYKNIRQNYVVMQNFEFWRNALEK